MTRGAGTRADALVPEWDELATRLRASPFERPGWVLAWARAHGFGVEPVTVRDGPRLVGVLPVRRVGRTLGSPTTEHTPLFRLLAETAPVAEELLVRSLAGRPRLLELRYLDEEQVPTLRRAAERAGYRVLSRTLLRSPWVPLDGGEAAYLDRLDAGMLREIRRRGRRLDEMGRLELEVADGRRDLDRLLAEGFAIEGSGWKRQQGTAMVSDPVVRRAYEDVAAWAADRGWLRLAFLRLDGRPLAFDYALEWDGHHALVKTGYDPAFRRYGPGLLLRLRMLRRAHHEGLRTYEFLGHDDPWKLAWTSTVRERVILDAYRPSLAGTAGWAAERYGRPIARLVRRGARAVLRR